MKVGVRLASWGARRVPRRMALGVYQVPWLAGMIRSALNLVVPRDPEFVEVAAGPLAGVRVLLDLSCEKYLWLGTYEAWIQEALLDLLKPGDTAWDVGAFIGYHTLLMRSVCGLNRVVAVEPDPANRARLELNLIENGATDVRVVPKAAGAYSGLINLKRHPIHASGTSVSTLGSIRVPMTTLDALVDECGPPNLVKVDVEGTEVDVIEGANWLVNDLRPIWIIEVHGPPGIGAVEILKKAGYGIKRSGKGWDVPTDLPVGGTAHFLAIPS